MASSLDLQAFIVRARVLKLYRQALRVTRRAPIHARDELRHTVRQEMETNRHCDDKQRIRFLISEGSQAEEARKTNNALPKKTRRPPGPLSQVKSPHGRRRPVNSSNTMSASASIYRCANCGTDLNLSAAHLFPAGAYFEAGNKGTLSFSWVDDSKLKLTKEDKMRPFFETVNYWGIQRKRTKMQCDACGFLVGYVYGDGPPMMNGTGQFGMGPSQVIPRCPRFRFKDKALALGDS